jgi:hypothetical protein
MNRYRIMIGQPLGGFLGAVNVCGNTPEEAQARAVLEGTVKPSEILAVYLLDECGRYIGYIPVTPRSVTDE